MNDPTFGRTVSALNVALVRKTLGRVEANDELGYINALC